MPNAARLNFSTNPRIRQFLTVFGGMLGLDIDLVRSPGFRISIDSKDGNSMYVRFEPYQGGVSFTKSVSSPVIPVTGVTAALTAGVNNGIAVTSAAGDNLVAHRVLVGGQGTLVVTRVNGTTANVTSYRKTSDGSLVVDVADTSSVEVFNLGQA